MEQVENNKKLHVSRHGARSLCFLSFPGQVDLRVTLPSHFIAAIRADKSSATANVSAVPWDKERSELKSSRSC